MKIIVVIFVSTFFCAATLHATTSRKGFHEGPYLILFGGAMEFDWDINQRTHVEEARGIEPAMGLGFGWNIRDWFAPELFMRFTTSRNNGRREHIGGANAGITFAWAPSFLNRFEKWVILPFLRPGVGFQLAAFPGDVDATETRVVTLGVGPSFSGGIRLLFNKYFYMGIETGEKFFYHEIKYQQLSAGSRALIYDGGWKNQRETFLMVGVHY